MIEKTILENQFVRLEPLEAKHAKGIWKAGSDTQIWKYMPVEMSSEAHVQPMIQFATQLHESGSCLAFAIVNPDNDTVVGSTGFWNADLANKRAEIGFTWITPSQQRTPTNTACKLLLLEHAFESLGLNRVEFKTDALNTRSQTALERIGATREGTLRQHMIQPDGRIRDSVYYSIVAAEWTDVQSKLQKLLRGT